MLSAGQYSRTDKRNIHGIPKLAAAADMRGCGSYNAIPRTFTSRTPTTTTASRARV